MAANEPLWYACWQALWTTLALPAPAGLLERLLAAWHEPQRHYHTLQHLEECLTLFDELRDQAQHPLEVELALWFHDAVYHVRAHDNEACSARWTEASTSPSSAPPQRASPTTSARSAPNTPGSRRRCLP